MLSAAGVKGGGAFGTRIVCGQIFVDRKLMSARAAHDRFPIEFRSRPDGRIVIRDGGMTFKARIPTAAAFEFDRDDVQRRVPMPAARLYVYLNSVHLASVDNSHE